MKIEAKKRRIFRAVIAILVCSAACILYPTVLEAAACYVSSPEGLNFRAKHSTDNDPICVIPYGTELDRTAVVIDNGEKWAKVSYQGQNGYVAAGYLTDQDPHEGMEYAGTWRVTAYAYTGSPCANGNYPSVGYTVAQNSLPFGTEIYIDGVGFRTVEDRGPNYLGEDWCDLYLGDVTECVMWGDQYRDIWIVREAEDD